MIQSLGKLHKTTESMTLTKSLMTKDLQTKLLDGRDIAQRDFKISGTPWFFINGKWHPGEYSFAELKEFLKLK